MFVRQRIRGAIREYQTQLIQRVKVGKLSICLFVCLYVCLYFCLSVCLSVCLFVCLFVCLSVCLFYQTYL